MKQLDSPSFNASLVKKLTKKLTMHNATDLWDRNYGDYKLIKTQLTTELLKNQSHRCAYCGSRIFETSPHRDHIAPKVPYYKWVFWPLNLVIACYTCNSDRKKTFNPVVSVGKSYKTTQFNFVHPYYDDPTLHIKFTGHRLKILICAANSSPKGQATIDLFDLASTERSKQRAKDALFDSDVLHLHGKWKRLFEQIIYSPLPQKLIVKI